MGDDLWFRFTPPKTLGKHHGARCRHGTLKQAAIYREIMSGIMPASVPTRWSGVVISESDVDGHARDERLEVDRGGGHDMTALRNQITHRPFTVPDAELSRGCWWRHHGTDGSSEDLFITLECAMGFARWVSCAVGEDRPVLSFMDPQRDLKKHVDLSESFWTIEP